MHRKLAVLVSGETPNNFLGYRYSYNWNNHFYGFPGNL